MKLLNLIWKLLTYTEKKKYYIHVFFSIIQTFFETVYNSQKKRIFNALKNSSSDSVIRFKEVLKKIIDGK